MHKFRLSSGTNGFVNPKKSPDACQLIHLRGLFNQRHLANGATTRFVMDYAVVTAAAGSTDKLFLLLRSRASSERGDAAECGKGERARDNKLSSVHRGVLSSARNSKAILVSMAEFAAKHRKMV